MTAVTLTTRRGMAAAARPLASVGATTGGIATPLFLFVLYLNLPTLAAEFHGVPEDVAELVVLVLVAPLIQAVVLRREPLLVTPTLTFVLLYVAAVLVSAASSQSAATVEPVKELLFEGVLLFVLVSNTVRTTAAVRRAVWALVAAAAVMAGLSVFQQATHAYDQNFGGLAQITTRGIRVEEGIVQDRVQPRLAGPIGEKNRYAQVLLVVAPLALVLARAERRRRARLLALGGLALVIAGMVLTFSRGAAVAGGGLVVALVALRYLRLRHVLIGGLAFVALVGTFAPAFFTRVGSVTAVQDVDGGEADGAIVGRATASLAAWHTFLDHPVVGVGPQRFFWDYSQEYGNRLGLRHFEGPRRAHNLYLEIAADLGLLGLGAFVGLMGVTLTQLDRQRRRCRSTRPDLAHLCAGFELALGAYLISGLFLHLAFQRYLWLLLALASSTAWAVGRETAVDAPGAPVEDGVSLAPARPATR